MNSISEKGSRIRLWPTTTLIILAAAIIAGVAALLWTRYERTAEAKDMPTAVRVERVDGQVALNRTAENNSANSQWVEAITNTPISVGDRVLTREKSRAEIAFTGRNFATLEADTSLDVLDLADQKTQVALRDGAALFDIGSLNPSELFEIATPCGAVDLEQAGVYQIAIDDKGNAVATTLNGLAQVVGQSGTGKIEKGEVLSVPCQGGSSAVISSVDERQAGAVLDSYYRYRYPKIYDGRYSNYSAYLADPYFYDPYRRDLSYQYVGDYVPGVDDLDEYGDWEYVGDYGYCWSPRVNVGWAPYQSGYWDTEYPFGETWISYEPWGYAPYHYGRWVFATNRWFWIPERVGTRPVYSPAMVAFFSFGNDSVGWVPLGPGDPFVPRYYDRDWRARFLGREEFRNRLFNQNVAGAVTVVSSRDFNRRIDSRILLQPDAQAFARARPIFDPLSVDPLRRAAFAPSEARQRIDVPSAIAQRINSTRVVTSGAPFRPDLARVLRVEPVPDRLRNQALQVRDERSSADQPGQSGGNARMGTSGSLALDQAREREMAELSIQAARGNRGARQQLQSLQRQQLETRRSERVTAQQTQGAQTSLPDKERSRVMAARQQQQLSREAGRQPSIGTPQQRGALPQQRVEATRVGNRVRNAPPTVERHIQSLPQSGANQPQVQRRVMRQPLPPRVQTGPPFAIRPQRAPQAQSPRLPPVQVRPPQAPMHVNRPPAQAQPQARPVRVEAKPSQAVKPPAASQPQGNRNRHP